MNPERGMTLIELVVAIVVVAIGVGAILGVLAKTAGASADPMVRHQAIAIGEGYLEEILLKPVDDPDGTDGEAARVDFDDVDDYNGLNDVGARDQFDNPIAGLGSYTVAVTVAASAGLPGVPAADALRIDVNVSRAPDVDLTLTGYRTRF